VAERTSKPSRQLSGEGEAFLSLFATAAKTEDSILALL
jgi:hypothetical protein